MNEFAKTSAFLVAAVATLGLAGWTWNANRPVDAEGFGDQGQAFFPGLEEKDVELQALEIHALDDKGNPQEFVVRKKDGVWAIPSHYNYPAEGAERLASSMSALKGLVRKAVDSRSREDHEKRGLLDPLDPEILSTESTGKRVTIKGAGDVTLADLIIGKKVESTALENPNDRPEDNEQEDLYFVRVADEATIYRIPLNLDISTRFSDWINTDLLDLGESAPTRLMLDSYELVAQKDQLGRTVQISKKPGDKIALSRPDAFGTWLMQGLRADIETLKTQEVNATVRIAENLEIRGVRPKFTWKGLQLITPDLKLNLDPSLVQNGESFQKAILHLQDELAERGFNLVAGDAGPDSLALVAEYGEVELGCDDGLSYSLYFGKSVSGDEKTIEIGDSTAEISVSDEPKSGEVAATGEDLVQPPNADEPAGDKPADDAEGLNRFVMVRVSVDESLLGAAPVAPVEPKAPTKPEGYVPAAPPADANTDGQEQKAEETRDLAFVVYDQLQAGFDQMKTQYELDLLRHKDELKALGDKRTAAQKRSADLNVRFGAWYYVVSAANLNKLRSNRSELVEPIKPDPNAPPTELPEVPDISFGNGG